MNPVSKYLAAIGAKGGHAGKGASKRRSRAHYSAAAKKRWAVRRAMSNRKGTDNK